VVVSLPCTNLGSAAKRLKESDLVVTHPGNSFGSSSDFKTQKQHFQRDRLVENKIGVNIDVGLLSLGENIVSTFNRVGVI